MTKTIDLKYKPRAWQSSVHSDHSRFRVIALHRRGGKSTFATMEIIHAALKCDMELGLYVYIAPFLSQAKAIAWGMIKFRLKEMIEAKAVHINEAELTVTFVHNGAKIKLYGADNPDSMRGIRLDGCVMDEVANMKAEIWDQIVQPALSDRKGFAIFIGTPSGINLFSEKYFKAKTLPDWGAHLFTVYDTQAIDVDEVERLRRDMSEQSFSREFLCDFNAAGDDQLITLGEVETAANKIYKPGEWEYAPKIIGIDPARYGDDSSVIIKRQGFMCFDPISFQGLGNMELADQVAHHINTWHPDAVFCDAGNGSGVIDRLRQIGHDIIEVPFNGKSGDPACSNKRAEMYVKLRDWMRDGGHIPEHHRLKQDLATPRYWYDKYNRIILEPKDDIKSRGLPSSDYSDALALTFAMPVGFKKTQSHPTETGRHISQYEPLSRDHIRGDDYQYNPRG